VTAPETCPEGADDAVAQPLRAAPRRAPGTRSTTTDESRRPTLDQRISVAVAGASDDPALSRARRRGGAPERLVRRSPNVTVVGAGRLRRRIERLLADAELRRPEAQPAAVVLVIDDATNVERARAIAAIGDCLPAAPILAVMPADASNASLRRVLAAGARSITLDRDLEHALVPSLRAMLAGQLAVPAALTRQLAPRPLSHREKQILGLVVRGYTNREIGLKLYLAESTVKTHLSSSFRKLDARSRSEAVARILDPESGYGIGVVEATPA
jgi:DNA-binding NarL/FixJ family response regulator